MNVKNVLKEKNFIFKKAYGQNFLTDLDLLGSIVERSGVDENSIALEIGVGAGTLTGEICKRVKKVIGFEIDKNLQPVLDKTLADYNNVQIVYQDVMKMTTAEVEEMLGGRYTLIANLPYYVTTPIIMRFIEEANNVDAIVVTVQKEVAERLVAKEKSSDYGAITVAVNAWGDSEIIEYIGREKFYPSPNVDSAVVKITLNKNKYDIKSLSKFRELVKNAFAMRRKTLVNNLMKGYGYDRQTAENLLTANGFSVTVRGEELSVDDFVKLANYVN